eukprot:1425885-Prymnesium_polylepis.1
MEGRVGKGPPNGIPARHVSLPSAVRLGSRSFEIELFGKPHQSNLFFARGVSRDCGLAVAFKMLPTHLASSACPARTRPRAAHFTAHRSQQVFLFVA